ncbi:MAG: hypothetical protein U0842_28580 [Candidatus Binatia bacterium]
MMKRKIGLLVGVAAAAAALVPGTDAQSAGGFTANVTNPWYPLKPGTTFTYKGTKDVRPSREVLKVTRRTKLIDGVPCRVLDDRLYLNGRLAERTTDWYSQDSKGNVWYYGEATAELDAQGKVTSTEGSWKAGVDGARPGIFMPAHPKVGQSFRQEYYKGHAEDRFRVLGLHTTVKVPYISSTNALLTRETTALEPGVIDHKVYVRGIGTVKEETVKGGNETAVLVSKTS